MIEAVLVKNSLELGRIILEPCAVDFDIGFLKRRSVVLAIQVTRFTVYFLLFGLFSAGLGSAASGSAGSA